jgi:hypothetical protein
VLVPTDSAILRMERKPHQNKNGKADTDHSSRVNIEKFLSSHIIPVSGIPIRIAGLMAM